MTTIKKIGIIGTGHIGPMSSEHHDALVSALTNTDVKAEVITVDSLTKIEPDVIINGVGYKLKESAKKDHRRPYSRMAMTALAFAAFDPFIMSSMVKTRQRPNVNIITEYGLIQEKKSKLSASDRRWVVYQFESKFEKIV